MQGPSSEPKESVDTIFRPNLSIMDVDEQEIARQLCLMEYQIFSKIKVSGHFIVLIVCSQQSY